MAREDLIEVQGIVTHIHAGGLYTVKGDNAMEFTARLCGRMRTNRIRVVLGDRVTVGVSPYDPSHGLITFRAR
jgi:translation initiation factor IF-1